MSYHHLYTISLSICYITIDVNVIADRYLDLMETTCIRLSVSLSPLDPKWPMRRQPRPVRIHQVVCGGGALGTSLITASFGVLLPWRESINQDAAIRSVEREERICDYAAWLGLRHDMKRSWRVEDSRTRAMYSPELRWQKFVRHASHCDDHGRIHQVPQPQYQAWRRG